LNLVPASALTARLKEILQSLVSQSGDAIGDYLEFGVYNGNSMACMFKALSSHHLDHVRLYGFDSFQGLPSDSPSEDGGVWRAGQFACPMSVTVAHLESEGIQLNRVSLIEGWYKNTLAPPATAYGIRRVSIVMIDCDTYSSAQLALEFSYPVLTGTSMIICDDWKLNDLDIKQMGEYRAFNEFLESHPDLSAKAHHGYNRKSMVFTVRKLSSTSD
jgi:hypothetical protein